MKEISITCEDGFELSGSLYKPKVIKAAIMIAPATGIKRHLYNSFATYLSENEFGVLTFDNRGIGGSRGDSINGVNASLVNWGRLDMTAVLEQLKRSFPDVDYHLIGHSSGGQLAGLMKNANDLKSMFNFGSSSGSLEHAPYPFKLKSSFFLNFYIPISNLLFGHTKSQWVGMGEPLPKLVGKQWRKWCNGEGYVKQELGKSIKEHLYDELTLKSLWLQAKDDDIANIENVKDMIRVYSKISSEIITLNPTDYKLKDIGHMKFFSLKNKILWSITLDWLNKN
jgi:predicted alpha/beta hydrolase